MNLLEIAQTRRSLRSYLPNPVEEEKLRYIVECARLAPSWKNSQCWRFIIVEDPEKRQALADSFPESNPGRKAIPQAPVVVVLCADPTEMAVWEEKDYGMLDAGLAMEQLVLAATEQGLGTCWMGLFSEAAVRQALNIPEAIKILAMSPLGYANEVRNPRPRKAVQDIAYRGTWGETF